MAKQKNDYFQLLEQQVAYCVQASDYLTELLCSFSASDISDKRNTMHNIEHAADELRHHILTKLSAEFITPIDQEDILMLVQIIDDVTDALDEVVLEFYMFHITQMPSGAPALSKIVNRCVKSLYQAVKELKNFKKPTQLRQLLVDVNQCESDADAFYIQTIHDLFSSGISEKTLFSHKEVYDSLENCCDLCEHAADVIEQIIIKNT